MPPRPQAEVRYVGSSTVAVFLRKAEPIYGALRFQTETAPESEGGLLAIRAGRADLAGVARRLGSGELPPDASATLIGRDAIAVIVHAESPVHDLAPEELAAIFQGRIRIWSELGGPDLPVLPFVVGAESATHAILRDAILGGGEYEGCTEIRPDAAIIDAVAAEPGGIGQISFSFLQGAEGVRTVAIGGEEPVMTNLDYPISRPLYLLWKSSDPALEAFADWVQTDEGQRVVMRDFIGTRVVASSGAVASSATGKLLVLTETYPVYDGGIYYRPHRPYDILDRRGEMLRRVPNHRGENDESPMEVHLPPGVYVIRAKTSHGDRPEFFVTIEAGKVTRLDVARILGRSRP